MKQIKEILIASVSLFLLGFGICMAVSTFFMYREGEQEYEALREYVNEEEREEDESEEQDSTLASKATVDFQALRKINSDIIAWIRIPDTKIDYPIVQGKNNAYYLKHMFQKTEHAAGSIFLDVDNEADFSNRKSILYGHNMKDGSMFQGLHRFQEESYLQEHNQVYLYLPDNRELVYKVIKCGYVKADSDTFWLGEPVETPQLLLSTCGADSSKRLVVWCELPQEEEEMTEENIKDIEILDFVVYLLSYLFKTLLMFFLFLLYKLLSSFTLRQLRDTFNSSKQSLYLSKQSIDTTSSCEELFFIAFFMLLKRNVTF